MKQFSTYVKTVVGGESIGYNTTKIWTNKKELDKKEEIVPATYDGVF